MVGRGFPQGPAGRGGAGGAPALPRLPLRPLQQAHRRRHRRPLRLPQDPHAGGGDAAAQPAGVPPGIPAPAARLEAAVPPARAGRSRPHATGGLEPRPLPGGRTRALRRLPYPPQPAGRGDDVQGLCRRLGGGLVCAAAERGVSRRRRLDDRSAGDLSAHRLQRRPRRGGRTDGARRP